MACSSHEYVYEKMAYHWSHEAALDTAVLLMRCSDHHQGLTAVLSSVCMCTWPCGNRLNKTSSSCPSAEYVQISLLCK